MTDDPRELVVVDQFEELYTLCEDPARRDAFIDRLLALAAPVVIGVRADLYGRLSDHADLARAAADNQILLGAMGDEELERAITEPARVAGLRLEPGLVELILRDVAREPGALPLLSHALRVTWEQRDGRTLTVEGYRSSGGVASAIARTADSVVEAVPADRRNLVRNLFLRLTETGEGAEDTRRRVAVEELVPEGASPEEVHELLDRLAEARLVTLGQGTAEVAHEVLIREWPTLRAWLEEDRAGIRLQRRLGDAARLWEAGTREAADLYRGTRLAAALEWAQSHPDELNAGERAFLDASVAESERERRSQIRANRRLRVLLGGVGLLLVAAVIAGVLALRAGDRARDTARTADAQRLGAQALVDDRLERSLLLAQAGRVLDDSVATRGNLLSALVRHPAAVGVLRGGTGAVFALALSPDGRTLAAGDDAGSVVLIDTRTRERIGRPLMLDREVWQIGFSPDGRLLAVTSGAIGTGVDAHSVKLLDTASMRLVREIDVGRVPGAADKIVDARFDATGRAVIATVASNSPDVPFPTQLRRYDVRTGRPIGRAVRIAGSNAIPTDAVSSRRMLFSAGDAVVLVDPSTLRVIRRVPVRTWSAGLSPDGRSVGLGGEDGSVRILDLETGKRRTLAGRHEDRVQGLVFSSDGRTLATRSDDGRVLIWDLRAGNVRETLTGHTGAIPTLVASADGRTLYTGGLDKRIIVWDLAGDRRLARSFQVHPFRQAGFSDFPPPLAVSPSGRIVAAGRPDGGVSLHDARTLRHLRDLPGDDEGPVMAVEFSPDGAAVAATGEGGQVELRDVTSGRPLWPPLPGLGHPAQALGLSPDGGRLAVADLDGNLRLLDLKTGAVLRSQTLDGSPLHLSFSPDGRTLAVGLGERTELRDGRSLRCRRPPARRCGSRRGRRLGPVLAGRPAAGRGGVRRLHAAVGRGDAATRRSRRWPVTRPAWPRAEFSPDGRMLATSGLDGTVILWDVRSRRALGTLPGPLGFTAARFSRDGRRLFVLRETGLALRWEVTPDAWSQHACRVAGRDLTRAEWADLVPDEDYRRVCRLVLARPQLGQRHRAPPERLVREPGAAVGLVAADPELVVEVGEVLLDGRLGDHELLGDRPRRGGLGEHVAVEQRPAQREEHVALAGGQRRRGIRRLGHGPAGGHGIAEDQARLTHSDLVAVAEAMRGPDALPVDPGAVGGAEVGDAPGRREPLEDGMEVTGRGIVLERDVVLGCLADGGPVGFERDPPAASAGYHLDLRMHGPSLRPRPTRGAPPRPGPRNPAIRREQLLVWCGRALQVPCQSRAGGARRPSAKGNDVHPTFVRSLRCDVGYRRGHRCTRRRRRPVPTRAR